MSAIRDTRESSGRSRSSPRHCRNTRESYFGTGNAAGRRSERRRLNTIRKLRDALDRLTKSAGSAQPVPLLVPRHLTMSTIVRCHFWTDGPVKASGAAICALMNARPCAKSVSSAPRAVIRRKIVLQKRTPVNAHDRQSIWKGARSRFEAKHLWEQPTQETRL